MRSRPGLARCASAATLLIVASTGCIFGRGPAAGVKPPPPANPSLTARVGLVVATNTSSYRRHIDSQRDRGIVVLFVQDGGPGDRAGMRSGDVITEIDGEPSTNAEYGVVQLRSENGQSRELTVVRPNGDRETVTVRARVPGRVDLVDLYTPMIEDRPDDPILRYLRAQAQPSTDFDAAIDDLDRALEIDERFAEALNLRAERKWFRSRDARNFSDNRREEYARSALIDWRDALKFEQRNTRALSGVAQASALLNQTASAKEAAQRALDIDEQLPSAHYAIGLSESVDRRDAEAAEAARKAIELNPFDVRYYELLGKTFRRLDRAEDCEETLKAITGLINNSRERARLLRSCI